MLIYQTQHPDEAFKAFNELYDRYSQRVFNFLNKKVANSSDCEDLLQKVFIKIHESKHLYRPKYKFEQWLFVIARTQVLDFFRASGRYQERLKNYTPDIIDSSMPDLSSLKGLDADQQELLEMKFIDELSYEEISKIVQKSDTSLRKSVSRLVSRLKKGDL